MNMQIISILALVLAIAIGYFRNVNTGFTSIAIAFVLGYFFIGMSYKEILAGYASSLFLTLFAMMFLFTIAKANGTLELVARKTSYLAKGKTRILPIVFFLLTLILSSIGPGLVAGVLMLPIAMGIAKEEKIPELLMALSVLSGCIAGDLSPISSQGVVAVMEAQKIGITNYMPVFFSGLVAGTIQFIFFYCCFGGLKLKNKESSTKKPEKFTKEMLITVIVIVLAILGIIILKWDLALTGITASAILLSFHVADEKKVFMAMAWGPLFLTCGVAVLINVVKVTGGIDVISKFLSSIMTERTSTGIMGVMGGLLSTVSGASSVVMTLVPTIPGVVESFGGTIATTAAGASQIVSSGSVSAIALLSGTVIGTFLTTYSPLSTMGAMALASTSEDVDRNKFFLTLLAIGFGSLIYVFLLGVIGVFGWFV